MRTIPEEVIASWPEPNYIDPVTRGPALIIVECIGLAIALVCLILRLYVRAFLMRNIGLDDWIMVAAMVFATALTVAACLASNSYGWDRHIWDLTQLEIVQGRQISLTIQAIFMVASALAKVSVVVSYLRLALVNSWFRKLCHGTIWLVIVSNSALFVVLWAQCSPVADYWNVFTPEGKCIKEAPPLMFQSVMTVLTDFLVWALPLWTLYRARLPVTQRVALIILFSFGLLVCVAGCVRMYWVHYITDRTYDPTWQGIHLWIWTAIEIDLGVICGCVPWLKSLVKYRKNGSSNLTEPLSNVTGAIGGSGALRSPKGGNFPSNPKSPPTRSHQVHDNIDSKWLAEISDDDVELGSYGTKSHRSSSTHPIVEEGGPK